MSDLTEYARLNSIYGKLIAERNSTDDKGEYYRLTDLIANVRLLKASPDDVSCRTQMGNNWDDLIRHRAKLLAAPIVREIEGRI